MLRILLLFLLSSTSLKAQPPGMKLMLPRGHQFFIFDAAFSPNGRHLATGGADNDALIWDIPSRRVVAVLPHDYFVFVVAYSPSGRYLATGAMHGAVKVWDANTGTLLRSIRVDGAHCLSFSADEERLLIASAAAGGTKLLESRWKSGIVKTLRTLHTIESAAGYLAGDKDYFFSDTAVHLIVSGRETLSSRIDTTYTRTTSLDSSAGVLFVPQDHHTVAALSFRGIPRIQLYTTADSIKVLASHSDSGRLWYVSRQNALRCLDIASGTDSLIDRLSFNAVAADVSAEKKRVVAVGSSADFSLLDGEEGLANFIARAEPPLSVIVLDSPARVVYYSASGGLCYLDAIDGARIQTGTSGGQFGKTGLVDVPPLRSIFLYQDSTLARYGYDLKSESVRKLNKGIKHLAWSDGKYGSMLMSDSSSFALDLDTMAVVLAMPLSDKAFERAPLLDESYAWMRAAGRVWRFDYKQDTVGELFFPQPVDIMDLSEVANLLMTTSYSDGAGTEKGQRTIVTIQSRKTLKRIHEFEIPERVLSCRFITPDGKALCAGGISGTVYAMQTLPPYKLESWKAHTAPVTAIRPAPAPGVIMTASLDATLKFWRASNNTLLLTTAIISGTPIHIAPGGYYRAPKWVSREVYYTTPSLAVIPFDQLDVRYHRPDLVQPALDAVFGTSNGNLTRSYASAYQKRIRRLGIDTTKFSDRYSVPNADFVHRSSLEYSQPTGSVQLTIRAQDSLVAIDQLNVWVNGGPVFGSRGISLRHRKRHIVDTTLSIPLSVGRNMLETSVTNAAGIESYRRPLYVSYNPPVQPMQWFQYSFLLRLHGIVHHSILP